MKKLAFLFALVILISFKTSTSSAQVEISVQIAPPELPFYSQPVCPGDGYMWMPGYWAYGDDGYYWVPGVWVYPPDTGYLWTPSYWGYNDGYYRYYPGYWGMEVGFYGGLNYGYGYGGFGFGGGRWERGSFQYNTAVMNVNTTIIRHTYQDRGAMHSMDNHRPGYNGPGGYSARPTPNEEVIQRGRHITPTSEQSSHQFNASKDRNQFVSVNHGRPTKLSINTVHGTQNKPVNKSSIHSSPGSPQKISNQKLNSPPSNSRPVRNERPVNTPSQKYSNPSQQHSTPPKQRSNPPQQRSTPPQQHARPPQQRSAPPRQHSNPPQQRENTKPDKSGH